MKMNWVLAVFESAGYRTSEHVTRRIPDYFGSRRAPIHTWASFGAIWGASFRLRGHRT